MGRVWRDSGRVYGAGKIKAVLEHEGIVMSRRRVNRIMKAGGMAASYSRAAAGRIRQNRMTAWR